MAGDRQLVDDYIGTYPEDRQQLLQQVRSAIHRGVPEAAEKIRYGLPVMLGGRHAIHFAGWENHIGLYAVPALDEPLETAIAPYRNKDALAFLVGADPVRPDRARLGSCGRAAHGLNLAGETAGFCRLRLDEATAARPTTSTTP